MMKYLLSFVFILTISLSSIDFDKKSEQMSWRFRPVLAATELDPGSINMSVVSGRADFVRFLYFLVAGPSSDYTISGPDGGYIGLINDVIGPESLGSGLISAGITTCSEIPTSGTASLTETEGTYLMTFTTGSKTIPSHFVSNASETYDKRVSVSLNGDDFMIAEFKCSEEGLTIGYLRMDMNSDFTGGDALAFETYYLQNSNTNAINLDFFQTSDGSEGEKIAVRFETSDGDTFKLWLVRTVTSGGGPATLALTGKKSENLAQISMEIDSTANGTSNTDEAYTISSSGTSGSATYFSECINMESNSTSTSCTGAGLTLSDPGTWNLGAGANSFYMQDIYTLSLTSL